VSRAHPGTDPLVDALVLARAHGLRPADGERRAPVPLPGIEVATEPTVGGLYESYACDANGKGVAACGSNLRIWIRPEGLPDRPGWWHVRCVRCDAPFLWRPARTS
jgi:hypothetical protein